MGHEIGCRFEKNTGSQSLTAPLAGLVQMRWLGEITRIYQHHTPTRPSSGAAKLWKSQLPALSRIRNSKDTMLKTLARWVAITVIAGIAPLAFAQQPAPRSLQAAQEAEGQVALAERLVQQAGDLLLASRGKDGRPPVTSLRQTAALTEAALRLAPAEPRFAGLLAQTYSSLGDTNGEITAWTAYRRLLPDDRVAQAHVIELYLTRLETADAKVAYLKDLLTRESIAPELKAHIAALTVPLLEQRSHEEAVAMVPQARQFYPLPEVLWMEYHLLAPDAPPAKRVAAIVDLLKSNPAQPTLMFELAHFLTMAGLHEEATPYYQLTGSLLNRMLMPANLTVAIEAAANQYRIGQNQAATQFVDQLASQQLYPDAPIVWFMKLTLVHGAESPEQLRVTRNAINKAIAAFAESVNKTAPDPPAALGPSTQATTTATKPSATSKPSEAIDLPVLAAKVKGMNDSRLSAALVEELSDRAWFEIYFANDPAKASPAMEGLKTLLPADDTTLVRLSGWFDLVTSKADEARKELSSVADKDSLSLLGMYLLEDRAGNKAQADQIGSRLLSEPTTGLLNAILYQAIKSKDYAPTTRPVTDEVRAELKKLPQDWLVVLQPVQTGAPPPASRFYQLRAEPLRVAHHVGEPMLTRITLTNVGKYDLSIGSAGLIQPDLWFDVQTRGIVQQGFPGIAFERLLGRTILRPGESISQVMRIDSGELGTILRRTPIGIFTIDGDVVLNPIQGQDGLHLGPGGLFVQFTKLISRMSEPLSSDQARDRFFKAMEQHAPAQKLIDLDTLAAYVRAAATVDPSSPDKTVANRYVEAISAARSDSSTEVAAWAGALSAELQEVDQRQKVIEEMVSKESWEARLLGLLQARLIAPEPRKALAARLAANDPDAIVKSFAAATVDAPELPTTAPSTTQPSNAH